jgi:hypothetical protein
MSNIPDLEAILECIICHVVPRNGPIFQCTNGHLICKECSKKTAATASCAMCQEPPPPKKIRSIAAEQVIEKTDFVFTCIHAVNGCNFSAVRTMLEKHEGTCESRMVPCPDGGNCKKSFPLNKLLKHLKTADRSTPGHKAGIFTNTFGCTDMTRQKVTWNVVICEYADTNFFIKFVREKGMFHTWLYIAGDADIAKKYQVNITVANPTIHLSYTSKVFSIDLNEENMFKRDDVLSFGESLFRKMIRGGRISINYEILKF